MRIVTREQWGAEPPRARPVPMKLPAVRVWLHHSATGTTGDPAADMRQLQRIAFSGRFSDVSYSWAVHSSGVVLEGRGTNVGAHTAGDNSRSFGVALIGDYTRRVVTDAQVDAVRRLVAWLKDQGVLGAGATFPTGGHRSAPGANTACPGEYAMRRLDDMRRPWAEPAPPSPEVPVANAPFAAVLVHPDGGYLQIGDDGGVFAHGAAPFYGSLGGQTLNAPIVDAAWTPTFAGYYLLGADGGIFTFGDAVHQGNLLYGG